MKHWFLWIVLTLGLLGGAIYFTHYRDVRTLSPEFNPSVRGTIERTGHYTLINPLFGCEVLPQGKEAAEFEPIKKAIVTTVAAQKNAGNADAISVYLRALNSGRTIGVDDTARFSPASLLKVALMTAAYKINEDHPALFTTELTYTGNPDYNSLETFMPAVSLQPHTKYRVDELINAMIRYSDNNAFYLVSSHLVEKYPYELTQVYNDLHIPTGTDAAAVDYLSAEEYSSVFRALYNATYLNDHDSEAVLKLLTQVDFKQGMVTGLSSNVEVAHKFGERTLYSSQHVVDSRELHECGIIYYPDHPYFLCVMTKGHDFQKLATTIAAVTKSSYTAFDAYMKQ